MRANGRGTLIIGLSIKRVRGVRTPPDVERDGLDQHVHGERGYDLERL